jgi:hypothetical protein
MLGERFDACVEALVSCGRAGEIIGLIERFALHWNHNRGNSRLGRAAFKAGERDIAERYLVKLRDGMESYYRSADMSLLAEIWHERGEDAAAHELLVDCMIKLVAEMQKAEDSSDLKRLADNFQQHRSTYLRLFPSRGNELTKLGIQVEPW